MTLSPRPDRQVREVDRRALVLASAGVAPLVLSPLGTAAPENPAEQPGQAFPGLISRQRNPNNLEFPFATLRDPITPTPAFFVRSHFSVPDVDAKSWQLKIEGAVKKPQQWNLEQIRKLPARTLAALLECSGNGRVFLSPRVEGVAWELGGVGVAEWTGVPLATLLEQSGVQPDAVDVILEGADSGELRPHPHPYQSPGAIHYARSLPLAKARRPEVLLAYRMNGADLTPAHGFPLRAVVAGWYGMASVKWLTRIVITDRPFHGYFQTLEYAYYERRHGLPTLVPVTQQQVKAQIARPTMNEDIPANRPYRIFGAAWAGEPSVSRVEVSTDGGKEWHAARLLGQATPFTWRFWEYTWQKPTRGKHVLMARASDDRGRRQPEKRDPDRRNAMISHVLPVEVQVH